MRGAVWHSVPSSARVAHRFWYAPPTAAFDTVGEETDRGNTGDRNHEADRNTEEEERSEGAQQAA